MSNFQGGLGSLLSGAANGMMAGKQMQSLGLGMNDPKSGQLKPVAADGSQPGSFGMPGTAAENSATGALGLPVSALAQPSSPDNKAAASGGGVWNTLASLFQSSGAQQQF